MIAELALKNSNLVILIICFVLISFAFGSVFVWQYFKRQKLKTSDTAAIQRAMHKQMANQGMAQLELNAKEYEVEESLLRVKKITNELVFEKSRILTAVEELKENIQQPNAKLEEILPQLQQVQNQIIPLKLLATNFLAQEFQQQLLQIENRIIPEKLYKANASISEKDKLTIIKIAQSDKSNFHSMLGQAQALAKKILSFIDVLQLELKGIDKRLSEKFLHHPLREKLQTVIEAKLQTLASSEHEKERPGPTIK